MKPFIVKTNASNPITGVQPTRGKGFLEPFLASLRAKRANLLIPKQLRDGRILDIGCGSYPYFLSHTSFQEKFAIDRLHTSKDFLGINWYSLNLDDTPMLPFPDGYFNVITMLAVIEHLNPMKLVILFTEAYRTLQPGGMVILTTPAAWSDRLLHWMANINLVSPEEIEEHAFAYTLPLIGWYFGKAGFSMHKLSFGYFELMLNLWATAIR
jgi:SAM-dependent methyltransferase